MNNGSGVPIKIAIDLERRKNISRNAGLIFSNSKYIAESIRADSSTVDKLREFAVDQAIAIENSIQEKLKEKTE
jgi:hypothetical protein